MDYLFRFLAGCLIVSAFAVLGNVLRPKSFAGLFGAAPSVGLATLALGLAKQGPHYVSVEGQSMAIGALALGVYAIAVCHALMRLRLSALVATGSLLILWVALAVGTQQYLLG